MDRSDVSICVATFGDPEWEMLAFDRAVPSALKQVQGGRVHTCHDPGGPKRPASLATARNACLSGVTTDWVVFLDADDELEPGYLDALCRGTADVRAPMVRYVGPGPRERLWHPRVYRHEHTCTAECLRDGNWVVIGAMVRTDLLKRVGWHDFPWSEDWATWGLCAKAGATFELCQDAVYRAHVRLNSRNRAASQDEKNAAHREVSSFIESYPGRRGAEFVTLVDRPDGSTEFRVPTGHRS